MAAIMLSRRGIGLAAPQVGLKKRLAVFKRRPELEREMTKDLKETDLEVLIDPEIISSSREQSIAIEGCLSIPDVEAEVRRPIEVLVRFLDRKMKPRIKKFRGLTARVVQHEIDHLDGRLFIERADPRTILTITTE